MLKEDLQRKITARFYQSLAASGVEITAIPQNQLHAIVNALADGLIEAIDVLDEDAQIPAQAEARPSDNNDVEETVIWTGKPYLSIGVHYELTTQRLRVIRGLLGRSVEEVELVRIRDTSVTQHMGERMLDVGDIEIVSNDPSHPLFKLHNVKKANDVREIIRKAVMTERSRRGFAYREEM
ncbi:MAG: PH domain-containing protein [Caldilineaceae bacterium]|nr:PH domain-containing protein [Caldilineaceae bacterium]